MYQLSSLHPNKKLKILTNIKLIFCQIHIENNDDNKMITLNLTHFVFQISDITLTCHPPPPCPPNLASLPHCTTTHDCDASGDVKRIGHMQKL